MLTKNFNTYCIGIKEEEEEKCFNYYKIRIFIDYFLSEEETKISSENDLLTKYLLNQVLKKAYGNGYFFIQDKSKINRGYGKIVHYTGVILKNNVQIIIEGV